MPCQSLNPHIKCFWGTRSPDINIKEDIKTDELIIPDTCMDIIFLTGVKNNVFAAQQYYSKIRSTLESLLFDIAILNKRVKTAENMYKIKNLGEYHMSRSLLQNYVNGCDQAFELYKRTLDDEYYKHKKNVPFKSDPIFGIMSLV